MFLLDVYVWTDAVSEYQVETCADAAAVAVVSIFVSFLYIFFLVSFMCLSFASPGGDQK